MSLILFSVSWNSQCAIVKKFLLDLQTDQPNTFLLANVDAEHLNEIAEATFVRSAPTVVLFKVSIKVAQIRYLKLLS